MKKEDRITELQKIVETLERRNKELHAQLFFRTCQDKALDRLEKSRWVAGGFILEIHALGGDEIVAPVCLSGLSSETIAALKKDFKDKAAEIIKSYKPNFEG